jgi:hypothetical protein
MITRCSISLSRRAYTTLFERAPGILSAAKAEADGAQEEGGCFRFLGLPLPRAKELQDFLANSRCPEEPLSFY